MKTISDIITIGPVIPVLTAATVEQGESACKALYEGGMRVIEVTLRTDAGLKVIERARRIADDLIIGVGTLTRLAQCEEGVKAGAHFGVSPGFTEPLSQAARAAQLPLLPGVMTPSDILRTLHAGYDIVKFFPAHPAGGVAMLSAFHELFPSLRFCPTGGINAQASPNYLALPNVMCVGGSWITPKNLLQEKNWKEITHLARMANQLGHNR